MTAFAGDAMCASAAMGTTGRLVVGTAEQPAACRTEGALLTFVDGAGRWMTFPLDFEAGATKQFTNFAPRPPHTTYPAYICKFLDSQGIQRSECQMVGPPSGAAAMPGDFYWALARRGLFADPRVEAGFALSVDVERVVAEAGFDGDRALFYENTRLGDLMLPRTPEHVAALLAASGVALPGGTATVQQARRCRVWTPVLDAGNDVRRAAAVALGAELVRVLDGLGVKIEACALVEDSTEADLFLWEFGQNLHVTAGPSEPTATSFLVATGAAPPARGDIAVPVPAAAGNAGIVARPATSSTVILALLAIVVVSTTRWLTSRRAR